MFRWRHKNQTLWKEIFSPTWTDKSTLGKPWGEGIIQLITFHEVNMVKWRTRDLVLKVVWPDRGRRPRSGQTTESTRSRDLHFNMLASWKVINYFIIPKKIRGQYTSVTVSIFIIKWSGISPSFARLWLAETAFTRAYLRVNWPQTAFSGLFGVSIFS